MGYTCRYTAGYPATPLQLKLRNAVGLGIEDVDNLKQQLEDTAALFAQQECVCVFNLVDDCQVWLEQLGYITVALYYLHNDMPCNNWCECRLNSCQASGRDAWF